MASSGMAGRSVPVEATTSSQAGRLDGDRPARQKMKLGAESGAEPRVDVVGGGEVERAEGVRHVVERLDRVGHDARDGDGVRRALSELNRESTPGESFFAASAMKFLP